MNYAHVLLNMKLETCSIMDVLTITNTFRNKPIRIYSIFTNDDDRSYNIVMSTLKILLR